MGVCTWNVLPLFDRVNTQLPSHAKITLGLGHCGLSSQLCCHCPFSVASIPSLGTHNLLPCPLGLPLLPCSSGNSWMSNAFQHGTAQQPAHCPSVHHSSHDFSGCIPQPLSCIRLGVGPSSGRRGLAPV